MGGRQLQSPVILFYYYIIFFFNICLCQKQNIFLNWWKVQSFKRTLQEKRHPFVIFPGWKSHPGVQSTLTSLPPLHPIKVGGAAVFHSFQRLIPLLPSEAFKSQDCFSSLIPQSVWCFFKPFSFYHLPLLFLSHSHELVDTLDTLESPSYPDSSHLKLYIWFFNFKLLWCSTFLVALN